MYFSALNIVIFCINPVLSLLFNLYLYFKRETNIISTLIISLSIALIFSYFPILYDVSSNFFVVNYSESGAFLSFYNYIPFYLSSSFGVQYISVVYTYTAFIIFSWFFIFHMISTGIEDEFYGYAFFYFIFMIIFRDIMDLNRIYLSFSILSLYVYLSFMRKDKIYHYFLVLLSLIIHPASLVVVFIYFISSYINRKIFIALYFISVVFAISGAEVWFDIALFLKNILLEYIHIELDYFSVNTKWGGGELSLKELISRSILFLLFSFIYYQGLISIKDNNNFIKFVLLMICFSISLLPFRTLFERYSIVVLLFSPIILFFFNRQKIIIIAVVFVLLMRFLFVNFYWRSEIFTSEYFYVLPNQDKKINMLLKPFYQPTALLLLFKINGYSDEYIKAESLRGK